MRAYIDSDIFIWQLRGEKKASRFLKKMRDSEEYELWTGALQRAEIVFFMKSDEIESTELLLSQFHTAPVDHRIIDTAGMIFRKWYSTHGIDINDAILAATSLETGGHIFTLNKKHYPMPDVIVKRAW